MVALPVTGLVGIAVVAASMYSPSVQERITTELGHAQARLRVLPSSITELQQNPVQPDWYEASYSEGASENETSPRDALPAGTRILPLSTTTVTATTATGDASFPVREGMSWDPSFAGMYQIAEGCGPHSDNEVAVTAALLPRLGAKLGDTVALISPTSTTVTIVGVLDDSTLANSAEQFYARSGALSGTSPWDDLQNASFYLPDTELSWQQIKELNQQDITVLSRSVLLNPPPADSSFPEYNRWGSLMSIMSLVAIVAAFAAFEVILLAGAAFTVTARQQQRTLATIASVGASRKLLFRILAANGIVLGAIGGFVGVGVGIGAAAVFMAITVDGRANQYYGFHLPWLGFLAAVVFAVLIGWIASLVPARTPSRFDVVAALRGARKPPTPSARRPVVGLAMLVGGVALTVVGGVLLALLTDVGVGTPTYQALQWAPISMLILGPILAQLGLVLCGPLLLRVSARLMRRSGIGARLAARDSARNPGRAVPAFAAIMTTVFVAVFGMCLAAGTEESNQLNWQYRLPLGTVQVPLVTVDYESKTGVATMTPYAHVTAVENAIRTSVDVDRMQRIAMVPDWVADWDSSDGSAVSAGDKEVAIPVIPTRNLCPQDPRSPDYSDAVTDVTTQEGRDALDDWRCRDYYLQMWGPGLGHIFVSDAGGLALALGHEPSDEAVRVLAAGGAVSLYRQYVDNGEFAISWWTPGQADSATSFTDPGHPLRTDTLPAVVELPEHPVHFGVFITKATADRLGLDYSESTIVASTKSMPTAQAQDALRQAVLTLPDNDGSLYANVETGPPHFAAA